MPWPIFLVFGVGYLGCFGIIGYIAFKLWCNRNY